MSLFNFATAIVLLSDFSALVGGSAELLGRKGIFDLKYPHGIDLLNDSAKPFDRR